MKTILALITTLLLTGCITPYEPVPGCEGSKEVTTTVKAGDGGITSVTVNCIPDEPEPPEPPDDAVLMDIDFEDYAIGVIEPGDVNFNPSYAKEDACEVVATTGIEGGKSTKCQTMRSEGTGHYRSELKVKSPQDGESRQGNETWVGVRMKLGAPFNTVSSLTATLFQFHTTESIEDDPTPDCLNQNPAAHLFTRHGNWKFATAHSLCTNPAGCKETQDDTTWDLGPVAGDVQKNTDWVVHVKWDARTSNPAGLVQVWKNGKQVINETLPTGFDCGTIPYLKFGIYAPAYRDAANQGPDWLVNHDVLKVAGPEGSYEAVAPSTDSTPPEPEPDPTALRWKYGHYIWKSQRKNDGVSAASFYAPMLAHAKVVGSGVTYSWRDVVKSGTCDTYNFALVKSDLDFAQSKGKYLTINIDWKRYNTTTRPAPDCIPYVTTNNGGTLAKVWETDPQTKYKALITALSAEIANHPALAAMQGNESSPGGNHGGSYSHPKYGDAIEILDSHTQLKFPKVPMLTGLNNLGNEIPRLMKSSYENGRGWRGPDFNVEPPAQETPAMECINGQTNGCDDLRGKMPGSLTVSGPNQQGKDGVGSIANVLGGINQYGVQFIQWAPYGTGAWDWEDAIIPALINANWPTYQNGACPSNIKCATE